MKIEYLFRFKIYNVRVCRLLSKAAPCRGDKKLIPTQYFCVGDC